jgi:hypothetical protein
MPSQGPVVTVPNRPFSTETITGLMLPDGVFESSLGHQRINAHFRNLDAAPITNASIYIEGASDPSIVIMPSTYFLSVLPVGGSRLLNWDIDVTATPPGWYQVSFIIQNATGLTRVIKKIFVLRVQFNPVTKIFRAYVPEAVVEVGFRDLIGPKESCCPRTSRSDENTRTRGEAVSFLNNVARLPISHNDPTFEFCPPGYLPHLVDTVIIRTPPFAGQYGDYPFQDIVWKMVLCCILAILLIAAAIACAVTGECDLTVTSGGGNGSGGGGGGGGGSGETSNCCGVQAEGGGSSTAAAGILAAAAVVAFAAGASDGPDPISRGEDHTTPALGELTTHERISLEFSYPDPISLGKPFAVGLKWDYTRITTGQSYTYSASDTQHNLHTLSHYEINAPNVVRRYKREPFIVRGKFFGPDGQQFRGDDLLVQCLLVGPKGQYRTFLMQDDGLAPDEKARDGVYTGVYQFALEENADGFWMYYVVAQDINTAQPEMSPQQQAEIVGGMVRTHQLTITIGGGTCPLVPDGDVNVIG